MLCVNDATCSSRSLKRIECYLFLTGRTERAEREGELGEAVGEETELDCVNNVTLDMI